jgi:hypothetical protein
MLNKHEKQKSPANWKSRIEELCKEIEWELGPELQSELSSRKELREQLFELSLVIY